jgi:hypothetical protein
MEHNDRLARYPEIESIIHFLYLPDFGLDLEYPGLGTSSTWPLIYLTSWW